MDKVRTMGIPLGLACLLLINAANAEWERVLVYSKTSAFRHPSITDGIEALKKGAASHKLAIDFTEDAAWFSSARLKDYQAIVLLNPSGNNFNDSQKSAFTAFYRRGGGVVGIHDAIYGEGAYQWDWPWFGQLYGADWFSHSQVVPGTLRIKDPKHASTAHLPSTWVRTEEWYNYKFIDRAHTHVLINLDETTFVGGEMGVDHPATWTRDFESGRNWFTIMGHEPAAYGDSLFMDHIWGGIASVLPSETTSLHRLEARRSGRAFILHWGALLGKQASGSSSVLGFRADGEIPGIRRFQAYYGPEIPIGADLPGVDKGRILSGMRSMPGSTGSP